MVGPTAVDIEDKEGTDTTMQGIEEIRRKAAHSVKRHSVSAGDDRVCRASGS